MTQVAKMIASIDEAIEIAHHEGFDVLNHMGQPDFGKIDEAICLSSWVLGDFVHESDQRIFDAALAAYKVEIEVAMEFFTDTVAA